jgi:hypothetical protein
MSEDKTLRIEVRCRGRPFGLWSTPPGIAGGEGLKTINRHKQRFKPP